MPNVKCIACMALIASAPGITPSSQVRAQSVEDECAKAAAAAHYAQQKKAYDKCIAETDNKKG